MPENEMSRRRRCGIILLAVLIAATLAFIWSNSSDDPTQTYEKSDGVMALLKPILDPLGLIGDEDFSFLVRKAAHFSEFALLGAELFALRLLLHRRSLTAAPLAVLCTAVIDETIQIYSERTSSTIDVIIDFFGGITGMLFFCLCIWIHGRIKRRRAARRHAYKSRRPTRLKNDACN